MILGRSDKGWAGLRKNPSGSGLTRRRCGLIRARRGFQRSRRCPVDEPRAGSSALLLEVRAVPRPNTDRHSSRRRSSAPRFQICAATVMRVRARWRGVLARRRCVGGAHYRRASKWVNPGSDAIVVATVARGIEPISASDKMRLVYRLQHLLADPIASSFCPRRVAAEGHTRVSHARVCRACWPVAVWGFRQHCDS